MALYSGQLNTSKRQKTVTRDSATRTNVDANDSLTGLPKIEYRPDAAIEDPLCYHYYNATEKVHGRTMEEWLRASISYLHIFQSSSYSWGVGRFDLLSRNNSVRNWDEGVVSLENYKRKLRTAFEFYSKLGIKYWTVFDRDLAPEGETIEETNQNLNEMVEFVLELQQRSNIKLLWMAANLHCNTRYSNGACVTSEPHVLSYTGAQLKKALEAAHRLGAESFLFRGSREGYSSPLNTDHSKQIKSYAHLLKMIADFKDRLGFRGQLLFEPNFEDHQSACLNSQMYDSNFGKTYYRYDYDTTSAICFLKHYGLDKMGFKINTKPGHQMTLAKIYGMLGSIDSTSVSFPPRIRESTLLMKSVIEHGGLQPGGINIGLALWPEPVDPKDLLVAYVNYIDMFARGLRIASKLISDGSFSKNLQQRYLGFHSGFGSRLINGEITLEECEEQTKKLNQNAQSDVQQSSVHSEHWESIFMRYCTSNKF